MMGIKLVYDISKFGKRDCPACGHSFSPPWKCPQWVGFVIIGLIVWVLVWAALH